MIRYSSLVLVIALFPNVVAVAQPIYGWKDEKGHWYFSDIVPDGVNAKKILDGMVPPESLPASPQTQPNTSSSAASKPQEKVVSKLPIAESSDLSPAGADGRWLLITGSNTQATTDTRSRFSMWRPVQSFDKEQACLLHKDSLATEYFAFPGRCIPASEFITGKKADVSITDAQFALAEVGFSSHLFSGRVFNRGRDTARHVVAKYQIRDRYGVIILQGEVSTSPRDIPAVSFGEFRTPSIGGWTLEGVTAQAEADWVKK